MTFIIPETKSFQQDLDIVNNELRGFIVSLYKFFSESKDCDWPMIYDELNNMNAQVEILLEQIKVRQERIMISTRNVRETLSTLEESESEEYPTMSNPFDFTPSTIGSSSLPFNDEIKKNSEVLNDINNRLKNLKDEIGIDFDTSGSLAEGFGNMMGKIGNLKRAKNYSNLAGLFDFS